MTRAQPPDDDTSPLALVGGELRRTLDGIELPMYVFDREGMLRWANHATSMLLGDRVGQSFLTFMPADVREHVKAQFARKLLTGAPTVYELAVLDRDGRRVGLRVRSAPLRRDGEIVGVFGIAVLLGNAGEACSAAKEALTLTPRQAEVLRLLADGLSTQAIADRLGVAVETARNHIRGVLGRLEVHSRLEAVVEARQRGMLDD